MNVTHIKNYDMIDDLPTDENIVSETDMRIIDTLFKPLQKNKVKENKICSLNSFSDPLLIGFLYLLLSLPCFDIHNLNISSNLLLTIKTFLIMILFWLIKIIKNYFL
jgi:hypothetical protein